MSKVLKFELAKRLNDLGLLDNIETEYWYRDNGELFNYGIYRILSDGEGQYYKTLTIEEAIEFLPQGFRFNKTDCRYLFLYYQKCEYRVWENNLLEGVENFIQFLLDNNLLTK